MASVNLSFDQDGAEQPPYSADQVWALPGWQQEEYASPHVIGDSGGPTRLSTFSTRATGDSDLNFGADVEVTGIFSSTGRALDTTLAGDVASTATYDADSKLLPSRKFPPVASGYEDSVLDMVSRMYGDAGVTVPWAGGRGPVHAYYPLRGYAQGFTLDGFNLPYVQKTWAGAGYRDDSLYPTYFGEHAAIPKKYMRFASPGGIARKDRVVPLCIEAEVLQSPLATGTDVNYQYVTVRAKSNLATVTQNLKFTWDGWASVPNIAVKFERTTSTSTTLTISGSYRQNGGAVPTTITTASLVSSALDTTHDLGFVVQWGYLTAGEPATLRVKAYMFDPENPPVGAPVVVVQTDLTNAARPDGTAGSNIIEGGFVPAKAGFRDLIMSQTDSTWPVHYPAIPVPTLIDPYTDTYHQDLEPSGQLISSRATSIPAWEGSGWDYLKMLCAARGFEFLMGSTGQPYLDMHLRHPDYFLDQEPQTPEPLENLIDEPVLTIQAGNRSRSIDVTSHRSIPGTTTSEKYRIRDLGITIEEDTQITVKLTLPEGEYLTGRLYFTILDDANAVRDWSALRVHGANCTATVQNGNELIIDFRGPRAKRALSGYYYIGDGPWTITEIGIGNVGFIGDPEVITLYTGAPEEMIGRDKGGDINNPFLGSTADIWQCATWLISAEGSPRLTLDFSVPASERDKLQTQYRIGEILSFGWAAFRVMGITHTKNVSTLSCEWFTTQATQSANWAGGLTADDFAAYWSGRRAYDVFIRPLASNAAINNPAPFVRAYPSESKFAPGPSATTIYGTGLYGTGTYG